MDFSAYLPPPPAAAPAPAFMDSSSGSLRAGPMRVKRTRRDRDGVEITQDQDRCADDTLLDELPENAHPDYPFFESCWICSVMQSRSYQESFGIVSHVDSIADIIAKYPNHSLYSTVLCVKMLYQKYVRPIVKMNLANRWIVDHIQKHGVRKQVLLATIIDRLNHQTEFLSQHAVRYKDADEEQYDSVDKTVMDALIKIDTLQVNIAKMLRDN